MGPGKTLLDFTLFRDWHEQICARICGAIEIVRRSSVEDSAPKSASNTRARTSALGKNLSDIVHEEDPTRPTTTAMAQATNALPDVGGCHWLELSRQRRRPAISGLHEKVPDKLIVGSETASAQQPARIPVSRDTIQRCSGWA